MTTTTQHLSATTHRIRDGLAARRRRAIVARDNRRREFTRHAGAYPAMSGLGTAGVAQPDRMPTRTR